MIPLSEKEGEYILAEVMPSYALKIGYKWTDEVADKLKALFLATYQGCITCPEYELRELPEPTFAYNTIANPVLGYLWLVRSFINFGNEIFRTVVLPVSNLGVVHEMVTYKDKTFRKTAKAIAKEAEWLHKWDLRRGLVRSYVSCHRYDLYRHNLEREFLPHHMRLWEYRCRISRKYMKVESYGAVLWGIGVKGAGLLPDHRVFAKN